MITEYKHMHFTEHPKDKKRKTSKWDITHNKGAFILGEIKWHSPWRQYCFFPDDETLYSKGCLNDISNFIQQLMAERKK